nr:hypothetical protein RKHAN_01189 [Rhizobium sp. Khangiran2]
MEYSDNDSRELTLWKMEREQAMAAHARLSGDSQTLFNSAMAFGLEAIRTATFINGGAVVAVFAFLGATFNSESPATVAVRMALLHPAFLFAAGAVLSGVASGLSYFSQMMFTAAQYHHDWTWEHPYSKETEQAAAAQGWGEFWRALAVASVILSYVALSVGLSAAYSSLSTAMTSDVAAP